MDLPADVDPLNMFVLSMDCLHGTKTDQTLSRGWSERPPLFVEEYGEKANDKHTLKEMCRRGVPPALRCAVWITSVVRATHPDQHMEETTEYGTLKKVRILDHGWNVALLSVFPTESDQDTAVIPEFGLDKGQMNAVLEFYTGTPNNPITDKGLRSMTRVLYAAQMMFGIEYCPLLPDLTGIMLGAMPESYTFAVIRFMANDSSYFFPVTKVEHYAWCKTFGDLMKRLYPQTLESMTGPNGPLSRHGLDPIFKRFFVPVLKREHVLRIMDIYTIEGAKVLFQFGTALLSLCTAHMKDSEKGTDSLTFWKGVRRVCRSRNFHFDILIEQAYGVHASRFRRRFMFPNRRYIDRLIQSNEMWAVHNQSADNLEETVKPLGLNMGDIPIMLAKDSTARLSLAEWLPLVLRSTKLDLIYSTNVHGRSVQSLYEHCAGSRHTILVLEVLSTSTTIGMFATHTWHSNPRYYGDGGCFLFRLRPDPVCFKWAPDEPRSIMVDSPNHDEIQHEVLMSQIMRSESKFVSMGGNKEGGSGLRLNEDLSRGSSSVAVGFNNDPLAGRDIPVFEIGLVEIYRLVREVDCRAVDGVDYLSNGKGE